MSNSLYHTTHDPIASGGEALAIGTTSATASLGFPAGTVMVRLSSLVGCHVNFGASASAGTGLYLAASQSEYFQATANGTLSCQSGTIAGTLYIKPFRD